MTAERFPLHPLGLRETGEELLKLRAERRRRRCLGQDPDACALTALLRREHGLHGRGERVERVNLAEVRDRLRAIGIV